MEFFYSRPIVMSKTPLTKESAFCFAACARNCAHINIKTACIITSLTQYAHQIIEWWARTMVACSPLSALEEKFV